MGQPCIYLAMELIALGITMLWVSSQWMRRGVRLHTWVTAEIIAGTGAVFLGFLPLLLSRFEILEELGVETWQLSMYLGAVAVLSMALASLFLPDTWLVGDISEEALLPILEKALARSELDPERTLTGLKLPGDVILRLYYWRTGSRCLLEWHPRGSSARFPRFQTHLREILSRLDCPPSRRRGRLAMVLGLLAVAAGGWILGSGY